MFADRPEVMLAPSGFVPALPCVWRVHDLLLGFVLVPVAFLLVVITLAVAGASEEVTPILGTLAFELALGGVVLVLGARRGLGLEALGLVWPRRWGPLVTAWLGSHAILIVYTLAVMSLGSLGVDVERLKGGNALPLRPEAALPVLVLLGVTAVLVAPVCEELFFRGLLYRGLRGFWTLGPALALSGVCFGLFHLNLAVLVPFALIGALFAWSTEASGSLLTSIGAHVLVNGLAFAATVAGVAE